MAPLIAALALTACGGIGYQQQKSAAKPMVVPGTQGSIPAAATADEASTVITGVPVYSHLIQGTGYTSVSVTVQTNRILKVQFIPGTQDRNVAGTGFTPQYSRMGVYIKVGSQSQPTEMLGNGSSGGDAEKSRILEFSNSFTRSCNRADTTCRQDVTITVEKPNYDYFCLIGYFPGCPWSHVWETHPWNGTLLVQTDDTDALSTN